MMGAVVTGRPVESAWLLHSERKWTVLDSPMVKHGKYGRLEKSSKRVKRHEKSGSVRKNRTLSNSIQQFPSERSTP